MFQSRREHFSKQLNDNSLAFFFSGKAPYKLGDEKYAFATDRNFYWLTGLDKENMVLLIGKCQGKYFEYLFIEPYDEVLAKWVGGRILPEQAAKTSSINAIHEINELWDVLSSLMSRNFNGSSQINAYLDLNKQEANQLTEATIFANKLKELYPHITILNSAPAMAKLRMIKDEDEINKLKQAIHVTDLAIQNMMKNAHAGIRENELEAHFDFVLKCNLCEHSFPSIVAGGKNATILHYASNDQIVKDNELVLCDLGASYQYLNADITRTFPVNGKFTPRQRQIYDIVLKGNKLIMSMVKPGLTLRELNNALINFYEKELADIGLLENGKKVNDYYWHGVSHMLGLETHDVTIANYQLEPGNVFTIEPGLYLEDENIGIRIEDNVLVTDDGCINLSADIIKEADDIEAFMKQYQN
ncbi:MAG: Xaa-Pro aminopeptidase [Erysipelotrichaceae bacterium]|nr:Xaa-Pro aminopeptidase [Erysipelotrichaceae bacterium]MDY5252537.1 Xaa-Pro aminopeptidase [Erysipelotrichaceae bacterium]